MNILIVNPNVWMGGAQKVLVQEALELSRLGHDVRILATRVDLSERPELLDRLKIITVDIPILDVVGGRYVPIRGRAKLLARLLRLRSAIREAVLAEGIDIVNPHHPPLHWASAGLGVPTVWTCHEPISLWPSAKPYFVIGDARLTPAGRAARFAYERLDPALVRRGVRNVIAVSESVADDVRSLYGLEARVIHSPVDTQGLARGNAAAARAKHGLYGRFVVTQVGHLTPVKNQICSIEAVRQACDRIPELLLLLIGDGPDRESLREHAARNGLESRVRFLGRLSDAELADCLAASNLLLLPARRQTWGLAAFEGLACGALPVVAADCGARRVIEANQIGLLVEPTARGFAERIVFARENAEACRQMACRGRDYVFRHLGYEAYGLKVEAYFREVLETQGAAQR